MGIYLEALKKNKKAEVPTQKNQKNLPEDSCLGSLGTPSLTLEKIQGVAEVATVANSTCELADAAEQWIALEAAINRCCRARKDSAENLAALLADCRNEPASDWPWWISYFDNETSLWTRKQSVVPQARSAGSLEGW